MANPGDTVEVITTKKKYEGILMPRPKSIKGNDVIIKLNSGYNIGISKRKIKKIKVIKKAKTKKAKVKKFKNNKNLPTISILSTGGTISSKVDYKTGGTYTSLNAEDFVALEPKILEFANIKARNIEQIMSENVTSDKWIRIAKEINKELNKKEVDGVVVTHGTDTMHYTTAILSFMFEKLSKPVVFVGAQRSTDRGSSDTFMNLKCAVIAATKKLGEITLCMHATTNDNFCYLHRGTKVRKIHTSRRDAFRSINQFPIAKIWPNGDVSFLSEFKISEKETKLRTKIEKKVALIYSYPGIEPSLIDYFVKNGYKGIVIAGTGLGHVPENLFPKIKKAVKKGIPVCITSQCLYGRNHESVYSNLRKLKETGAIFCEDMLLEVAYVKLMYVLGKTKNMEKIKELMKENLKGEINPKISKDMYMV